MNTHLLMLTFRAWLIEIPIAGVNYFLLMKKVYEPRVGPLRAHQIGMTTRIVYLFVIAYFLLYFAGDYTTLDTVYAGVFWVLLVLAFEWLGSLLIRRPVHEILVGWHLNNGYMWPYVLATYLLSPLLVGLAVN